MKPITFCCQEVVPLSAEEIATQILNLSKWPEFPGCWPIPGIKEAAFEVQPPEVVGTRIRVTNLDGSTHIEEIINWEPGHLLKLTLQDFSPPLSKLATSFDETWTFEKLDTGTKVFRSFELHPKTGWAKLPLRLIGYFLRRAIARHLQQIKREAQTSEQKTF